MTGLAKQFHCNLLQEYFIAGISKTSRARLGGARIEKEDLSSYAVNISYQEAGETRSPFSFLPNHLCVSCYRFLRKYWLLFSSVRGVVIQMYNAVIQMQKTRWGLSFCITSIYLKQFSCNPRQYSFYEPWNKMPKHAEMMILILCLIFVGIIQIKLSPYKL